MATTFRSQPGGRATAHSDKLHVLYGVLSLEPGGLERVVVDLVRECRQRGYQATVACLEKPGRLAPEVETAGAHVVCLDKPPGRTPQTIEDSARLLSELQPDVIHTHQIGALWYLGQAARTKNIPVLHTEHSDHIAQSRGWLQKLKVWLMWRRAAPLAASFCCVCDDIAGSLMRWDVLPADKIQVVLNGIDLRVFEGASVGPEIRSSLGIPTGALVIGTVGRLVEVKRQDLLLRSLAALRGLGKHANTWLLIVGDGPERQRLERLAETLHVSDRTIFAGYQPEPAWLYQAMDLFVLCSRHEGLPLAMLEAWAAGLPVVASAVGAIPQTVTHGVTGMLFESGDVAALTETLEGVLDSPSLLGQLGRRGRWQVESRYSLGRMAADYEADYLRLARPRARTSP